MKNNKNFQSRRNVPPKKEVTQYASSLNLLSIPNWKTSSNLILDIPDCGEWKHISERLSCNYLAQEIEEPRKPSIFENEWLTTKEAAEFLKIPVGSLRNNTSNGKVPFYKLPGTRLNRYKKSELQELLLSQKRGVLK